MAGNRKPERGLACVAGFDGRRKRGGKRSGWKDRIIRCEYVCAVET